MHYLHLKNWIFHHRISSAESLEKVLLKPFASLVIWFLIGVAFALPISGALIFKNIEAVTGKVVYKPSLTVFLDFGLDEEKERMIVVEIEKDEAVENVDYLNAEAALSEFGKESGLEDLILELESNPIPATLFLNLKGHVPFNEMMNISSRLGSISGVSQVIVDSGWLERLKSIFDLGYVVLLFLTGLLCSAVIFAISSMVRLSIQNRREEILVIKLVGGSDAFVRRPYLYMGLWYGFGGGLVASFLILLGEFFVSAPVKALLDSYESEYVLIGLGLMGIVNIAILSAILGILGGWIAVMRYIRTIEP